MAECFSCGKRLDVTDRPSRRDECPHCGADIWVCKNCRFYDEGAYNQCRESLAERVIDKERANHCEYFKLKDSSDGNNPSAREDGLAALKRLFGEDG